METGRQSRRVTQNQARGLRSPPRGAKRLKPGQAATGVRLQLFLAQAGVGSRRTCEQWITTGRVSVNGTVVRQLGTKVDPMQDRVSFDGHPVSVRRKVYLAMHKPSGCLCTRADPEGRPTVLDLLPPDCRNVYPVGRLDWDSEGLLFLTNDGQFALHITHPRYGCQKIYRVSVHGPVSESTLQQLVRGVFEGGERLKAERARVVAGGGGRTVVELQLAEGKNREVRRMFSTLGLKVHHLKRLQIGSVKLGGLHRGQWRALTDREIKSLLQTL